MVCIVVNREQSKAYSELDLDPTMPNINANIYRSETSPISGNWTVRRCHNSSTPSKCQLNILDETPIQYNGVQWRNAYKPA